MDPRRFMPRYTEEATAQHIPKIHGRTPPRARPTPRIAPPILPSPYDPPVAPRVAASILSPRNAAPGPPPRNTAPVPPRISPPILQSSNTAPILPPRKAPPTIPPRNPRRQTRSLQGSESADRFSQPVSERRLSRLPSGEICDISYTKEESDTLATGGLRRSNSTISRLRSPLISRTNSQEDFSQSLHEEIKSLRQVYIDRQSDDLLPADSPPRRRASNASLGTSVRNFSLPTYSSPSTRPTQPLRSLRKVRSRSVNLGPVAEVSELPEFPVRTDYHARSESPIRSEYSIRSDSQTRSEYHIPSEFPLRSSSRQALAAPDITTPPEPDHETEHAQWPTCAPAQLDRPLPPLKPEDSTSSTKSVPRPLRRAVPLVEVKSRSKACGNCDNNMKALALNPICCVDRDEQVCFKCWTDLLAKSLSKPDRKEWLRCLVCQQELVENDARRLADWKTVMKFKLKIKTMKIRGALPPLASYGWA